MSHQFMTLPQAVTRCLRDKYARFSGRASRAEYWWFGLAVLLYGSAALIAFFVMNGVSGGFSKSSGLSRLGLLTLIFGAIGSAALILPAIAVTVRRFHDVNLSGWWVLAGFVLAAVPLVGWIASVAILIVALLRGTTGENRFGTEPHIQT